MPVNIWNAGSDALLQHLARVEAQKMQAAALARQAQLDQENRDYRQATLDLNREQFGVNQKNIEDDNARALAAAMTAAEERKRARATQEGAASNLAGLTAMYHATQDPTEKLKIEQQIKNLGGDVVKPAASPRETRSIELQAADALARGDKAAYQRLLQVQREMAAAGRAPEKVPASEKPDKGLSDPVKAYLDTLPTKTAENGEPYSFQRALDEVRRQIPTWNEQVAKGQRGDKPDPAKIVAYLQKIFPAVTTQVPGTLGAAPRAVTERPGALPPGMKVRVENANGLKSDVDPADAAAIARLQTEHINVTPESIADMKQLIAAGR